MSDQPHETDDQQYPFDAEPTAQEAGEFSSEPRQPRAAPPSQLDPATEEDLWSGRASWKSIVPTLLLWLVVTLVVTIGIQVIFHQTTATLIALALCAAFVLFMLARTAWRIWSRSYRLTTQRLFIRRGILTQTVDQTELLRIDDVRMRQTLIQRLLGIGQVEVISSDRSDSALVLRDILTPEAVSEHIRRHTRTVQRRTLFMEQL
jgi:uncharacterized membrane protein YdbT with pleckstrin-like domain